MNKIKSTLCMSAFLLAALSNNAYAGRDVTFYNNSPIDSSVRITSGQYFSGVCATQAPRGTDNWIAANGGSSKFEWLKIATLCSNTFPCTAEVYLTPSHDCIGEMIGTVSLSASGNIQVLSVSDGHTLIGGDHQFSIIA